MNMKSFCWSCICGLALFAGLSFRIAPAGEAPGPAKPAPVGEEEKARLLAAETPGQKALRAELAALAKAGGRIYFNANCDGNNDIFVADCDGGNARQLTRDPAEDVYPHCSPDGATVVFTSMRTPLAHPVPEALKGVPVDPNYPLDSPKSRDRFLVKEGANMPAAEARGSVIWGMKPDGSDQKPLAFGLMPHWSFDGKYLVYNPWRYQLAVMNVEKRTEALVSHSGLRNCGFPAFAPDGIHVVGAGGPPTMVKLNAERTAVEQAFVIGGGHVCNGEVSPDGKSWAYVVDTDGSLGSWLHWLPLDYDKPAKGGGALKLGWPRGSINYYPCFSPDGKYLVYAHGDQQPGVKSWMLSTQQELYVTRFPDCEATVRITWNGAANQHPHWWSPPGGG